MDYTWEDLVGFIARNDEHRDYYQEQLENLIRELEAKAGDKLPEGAKWFPDEGGIIWEGVTYMPIDYVMTRGDIKAIQADVIRDAIHEAGLVDHSELIAEARAYWENNSGSGLAAPSLVRRLVDALEGKNDV